MTTKAETGATLIALILAVATAILSTPGQAGQTSRSLRWLRLNMGPSAAAMSAAMAENPRVLVAP